MGGVSWLLGTGFPHDNIRMTSDGILSIDEPWTFRCLVEEVRVVESRGEG